MDSETSELAGNRDCSAVLIDIALGAASTCNPNLALHNNNDINK